MNTNRTRGQQLVYIDLELTATHLTDPSVSHPAGLRRSFRLGRKSSWVREAARAKRWSTGVNGSNPPPTYREVIPYRRDPADGHRLVVLVGGYEQHKQCGWKHLRKVSVGEGLLNTALPWIAPWIKDGTGGTQTRGMNNR